MGARVSGASADNLSFVFDEFALSPTALASSLMLIDTGPTGPKVPGASVYADAVAWVVFAGFFNILGKIALGKLVCLRPQVSPSRASIGWSEFRHLPHFHKRICAPRPVDGLMPLEGLGLDFVHWKTNQSLKWLAFRQISLAVMFSPRVIWPPPFHDYSWAVPHTLYVIGLVLKELVHVYILSLCRHARVILTGRLTFCISLDTNLDVCFRPLVAAQPPHIWWMLRGLCLTPWPLNALAWVRLLATNSTSQISMIF